MPQPSSSRPAAVTPPTVPNTQSHSNPNDESEAEPGAFVIVQNDNAPEPTNSGGNSTRTSSQTTTQTTRRTILKMTRPEKAVLLQLFLEQDVASLVGDAAKQKYAEIAGLMRSSPKVRLGTRQKSTTTHVETYRRNYNQPLLARGGAQVPYTRNVDGSLTLDVSGKPFLDMEIVETENDDTPGLKDFWVNLIQFDKPVSDRISSSDETVNVAVARTQNQRASKLQMADKRRTEYAERRKNILEKRRKLEAADRAREEYKVESMAVNLQTQQQNALTFHALTAAYCSRANQPPPPPLTLPALPTVPQVVQLDDGGDEAAEDAREDGIEREEGDEGEPNVENENLPEGA